MSGFHHIATIAKNKGEQVRVSLTEFNGHKLVDIRICTTTDRFGGSLGASKKGVSLSRAKIPELIRALQKAEAEGGSE